MKNAINKKIFGDEMEQDRHRQTDAWTDRQWNRRRLFELLRPDAERRGKLLGVEDCQQCVSQPLVHPSADPSSILWRGAGGGKVAACFEHRLVRPVVRRGSTPWTHCCVAGLSAECCIRTLLYPLCLTTYIHGHTPLYTSSDSAG